MDDLTNQLNSILSDPKSMEMIQNLASSLLGGDDSKDNKTELPSPEPQPASDLPMLSALSNMNSGEIGLLLKIGNLLRSGQDDARTRLLLSLKPLLAPERRDRVDKAVKLLKIAELLPLLRESGFELF